MHLPWPCQVDAELARFALEEIAVAYLERGGLARGGPGAPDAARIDDVLHYARVGEVPRGPGRVVRHNGTAPAIVLRIVLEDGTVTDRSLAVRFDRGRRSTRWAMACRTERVKQLRNSDRRSYPRNPGDVGRGIRNS